MKGESATQKAMRRLRDRHIELSKLDPDARAVLINAQVRRMSPRNRSVAPAIIARQKEIDHELQAERESEQKNGKPRMSLRMEDIYGSNGRLW